MLTTFLFVFLVILISQQQHCVLAQMRGSMYYTIRRDVRRCARPRCGGFYVSPVNRQFMLCPNVRWRRSCYVEGLDSSEYSEMAAESDQQRFLHEVGNGGMVKGTFRATATGFNFVVHDGFVPFQGTAAEATTTTKQTVP